MSRNPRFLPHVLAAVAVVAAAGSAGAVTVKPTPSIEASKSRLQDVRRSPYSDCLYETLQICRALYPNNLPAQSACIQDRVDGYCATLPGAP